MSFLLFCAIVLIDILSHVFPMWGRIGTLLWVGMFIHLSIYAVRSIVFLLKKEAGIRAWFTIVLLTCITAWLTMHAFQIRSISGETTQEVACQLDHFISSVDWGYNNTCLFGYPARQMIIPALPSLLFGKSVFALHFGTLFYFILSLSIFSAGVLRYFGKKNGDSINAFLLASLFHLYFFNHFLFSFEQSIFPILFTFLLVGVVLQFFSHHDTESFGYGGYCLLILIHSYTPSLATYTLALCALLVFLLARRFKKNVLIRIYAIGFIVLSIVSLCISFFNRSDMQLLSHERSIGQLASDVCSAALYLIAPSLVSFHTTAPSYVTPLYQLFLVVGIFLILVFYRRSLFIIGFFWVIGVLVMAVVARGYLYYGVDFRLHRALVIFPLIMVSHAFLINQVFMQFKQSKKILLCCVVLLFISGCVNSYSYLQSKTNNEKHVQFIYWLTDNGGGYVQNARSLYVSNSAVGLYRFASLGDTLRYFYPHIQHIPTHESMPRHNVIMVYLPSKERLDPMIKLQVKTIGYFFQVSVVYIP